MHLKSMSCQVIVGPSRARSRFPFLLDLDLSTDKPGLFEKLSGFTHSVMYVQMQPPQAIRISCSTTYIGMGISIQISRFRLRCNSMA